jgi:hypothetical protein
VPLATSGQSFTAGFEIGCKISLAWRKDGRAGRWLNAGVQMSNIASVYVLGGVAWMVLSIALAIVQQLRGKKWTTFLHSY